MALRLMVHRAIRKGNLLFFFVYFVLLLKIIGFQMLLLAVNLQELDYVKFWNIL